MDDKLDLFMVNDADTVGMVPWQGGGRVIKKRRIEAESGTPGGTVGFVNSYGRRLTLARRFYRLATHDSLTGLPTLARVSSQVSRLIAAARRNGHELALISLDLDGLRLLSEAYGRAEADAAIKRAASVVRAVAPPHSVIGRNGTDGFVVVFINPPNAPDTAARVQQILDAIAVPRDIGGKALRITASAGVAMFPKDGDDVDALSRNAFAAMRESNGRCHGTLRFHSGNVALTAQRRLRLETDLRLAIETDELALYYQPQFEVESGLACGVEVLARWFRRDGAVEPSIFIPLAEQTGLIGALGSWVLQAACKTVHQWPVRATRPLTLSVNVSSRQIDEQFAEVVQRAIARTGFPAQQLELEITESALIGNAETIIECLRQLKEIGVRIAIDDFGTGYSGLSYLSRLPVDRLKLDKSLIHNLTSQWKDVAILRSIIALAKELGVAVIAEGVETEQQFQVLKQLGCAQVQGYLLARPAPPTAAREMLMRRWGARKSPSTYAVCVAPRSLNAS
jgi:diguanylate cyclase (GGDEF)-like protein